MAAKAKLLLVISFCLNAVLVAGWLVNRSIAPAVNKSEPAPDAVVTSPARRLPSAPTIQTITVDREKNIDWTSVESQDYREYIANLRAIGCPEETVRDIIIAEERQSFVCQIRCDGWESTGQ